MQPLTSKKSKASYRTAPISSLGASADGISFSLERAGSRLADIQRFALSISLPETLPSYQWHAFAILSDMINLEGIRQPNEVAGLIELQMT